MKRQKQMKRHLTVLVACGLLAVGTGCNAWQLAAAAAAASASASFGAGWLMGAITTPTTTETQCFRNGVQIDCSELQQLSE